MTMAHAIKGGMAPSFVADDCHPQTIAVLRTRAIPLGIRLIIRTNLGFYFGDRLRSH